MGKEMDLDTALSFSRQVLDQYRALKNLHTIIEGAGLAEQLTKELKVQIVKLTDEVLALEAEKQAVQEQVAQAKQEREEILAEAQKDAAQIKAKLKADLEGMDAKTKEKQAQIDGLDQELENGKAVIQEKLAELQRQADREESRLQAAREALAALKDKL